MYYAIPTVCDKIVSTSLKSVCAQPCPSPRLWNEWRTGGHITSQRAARSTPVRLFGVCGFGTVEFHNDPKKCTAAAGRLELPSVGCGGFSLQ